MNSQNISSNKSDFNWSTSFSYTGVQRFFQNPAPCTTFLRNGGIYKTTKFTRNQETTQKKQHSARPKPANDAQIERSSARSKPANVAQIRPEKDAQL
jgi:hypothetical protein